MKPSSPLLVAVILVSLAGFARADEIQVATASNFRVTMLALADRYEQETVHRLSVIAGSTGKHYAQISHGAPFDVFFAADRERPRLLEENGVAVSGSRFTYAIGTLALWSPRADLVADSPAVLQRDSIRHLAIANPELAPYGRAARETLIALGLWEQLQGRLVRGENVSQAFQFVHSGNVPLGLVAWQQVLSQGKSGSFWQVPGNLHQPIEQQAVLLVDEEPARDFMEWVRGATASEIIRKHGYDQP